jgi:hypothetical protein
MDTLRRVVAVTSLVLVVAGCDGSGGSGSERTTTTTAVTTTAPPTTVAALTARQFIEGFKRAGLPVGKVTCFNEDTDPNDLLGRPGGYIEKCDWADRREEQSADDLIGGSIETYERPDGAAMRAEELRAFQGGILSTGYTFVVPDGGRWVLRVDQEVSPTQARRYHRAMLAQL